MANGLGLDDAYGATLGRIGAQGGERSRLGMMTLMWICHSERPLEANELCHALAVEIGSTDFDVDNVPSIRTVLNCCQGLVVVDKEGSVVRLVHFTLREYLSGRPDLFQKCHSVIAETCLTYLNSQQVMNLSATQSLDTQAVPFLEYSALHWGTHAKKELSDNAKSLALKLFGQYYNHISVKLLLESHYIYRSSDYSMFTGLHCASFFGLVEVVRSLIGARGFDVNQSDNLDATPLGWAARNGHEEAVQLLLEWGNVDPDKPDGNGRTPLAYAVRKGYEGVVQLLLRRRDVNPNMLDGHGRTPLSLAAGNGGAGIVQLLLGRGGANPDRPDGCDQTPLSYAARNGHDGVVKLLLGLEGVNPDKRDHFGLTPLLYANHEEHGGVVKLLLDWESSRLPSPRFSDA